MRYISRSLHLLIGGIVIVTLCCLLWQPAPTQAATRKLNGFLGTWGDVKVFGISPDDKHAVYIADQQRDGVDELYSVPLLGGLPVRLNGSLVAGGNVQSFSISPDNKYVIYVADQDHNLLRELYSVPLVGGRAVKLNAPLASDQIANFGISPNANRVIYVTSSTAGGGDELYSVPVVGNVAAVRIAAATAAGDEIISFQISPDSRRVIYQADQHTNDVYEIYSAPLAGNVPAVKLNEPLVAGRSIPPFGFSISDDSSRVVYLADQERAGVTELFSVPAIGGAPVKLNDPLPEGGHVSSYTLSPDGSRVVYLADQERAGVTELFSVPATGGVPVKLNDPLPWGGTLAPFGFRISKDSSRVIYRADQERVGVIELFSVALAGGMPIKLNGPLTSGGNVLFALISDDSSRVVYLADQERAGVTELFSVLATGGTPVKLNGPLPESGNVANDFTLTITADSSRVIFKADGTQAGADELFSVPLSGGAPIKLNNPLPAGGAIQGYFFVSHDGRQVLYRADQDQDDVFELYVADRSFRVLLPLVSVR